MDVRINMLVAALSLLLFVACLCHKTKYTYYTGTISLVLYIHMSTNAMEKLLDIDWVYILFGHAVIFLMLYLMYHCYKKNER